VCGACCRVAERGGNSCCPLQGFSVSARLSPATSPSREPPSQGFAASRSSSSLDLAAYWFAATFFVVPSDTTLGSSVGRPVLVLPRGRLPQAWLPSQGSGLTAGQDHSGDPHFPSWGFSPLQRRGRQGPLHPGLPHPARSVLEVLSLLDGLLPCHLTVADDRRHSWGFLAPHLVGPCVRCSPVGFRRPLLRYAVLVATSLVL